MLIQEWNLEDNIGIQRTKVSLVIVTDNIIIYIFEIKYGFT